MGRLRHFNRDEVLEKAMPLFWKRGFADTGLQDIEKATGVNKSGLYAEFKNKEDLFLSALRHYGKTHKGGKILSAEPLGWNNIDKFFKSFLGGRHVCEGCFAVNSLRELALLSPEAQSIMTETRGQLRQLFVKNIAAEKTKMSPEALADMLMTFFSGVAIEQNLKAARASAARKAKDFVQQMRSM
jgi:TetR/AcrR family transcriptional regulator, copper-responsive repressor